jgi:DNA-directed RNA polymerase specialized sigma24 family protein
MVDGDDPTACDAPSASSETQRRLAAGLEGLPCLTRAVFLLHRIDNHGYDAIAWRCGISVDEVTLRMVDALTGLRRSCDSDPTFAARVRRALLPWRYAWMRWRREWQDRFLGL